MYQLRKVISINRERVRIVTQRVRAFWYRSTGVTMGKRCRIGERTIFHYAHRIKIGDNCTIGDNSTLKCGTFLNERQYQIDIHDRVLLGKSTYIDANNSITIMSDTIIAANCYITDSNHGYQDNTTLIRDQVGTYKPITIKQNVWIGAGCIILPGVTIEEGSVIAANSTVTKDVPSRVVMAGCPAKLIKKIPPHLPQPTTT